MKPGYKDFAKHKNTMLDRISKGISRREIVERLENKYTLTRHMKLLISGLGKSPQEQTVEEWLADYDGYKQEG